MKEDTKIRVMIADDHAVVRCGHLQPDVILMDLMMPGTDGIMATCLIRGKYPQIQVIASTSFQENELVQSALKEGAIGYLMKNVSAQELTATIRAARSGKMTLSPEAAQALVQASRQNEQPEYLTECELEVLRLMVDGLRNAEIAERVVVSLSTVKYQQYFDETGCGRPRGGGHDRDAEKIGVVQLFC